MSTSTPTQQFQSIEQYDPARMETWRAENAGRDPPGYLPRVSRGSVLHTRLTRASEPTLWLDDGRLQELRYEYSYHILVPGRSMSTGI